MQTPRIPRRSLLAAGALLVLSATPGTAAPRLALIEGFIVAREFGFGVRRVTIEDATGRQVTLTITPQTSVGLMVPPPPPGDPGGPAPTDLLQVGTFVRAQYIERTGVARSIGSEGEPALRGVSGILLGTDPIVLDTNGDGSPDATIPLPDPVVTYLFLDRYQVSHAELPLLLGSPVEVFHSISPYFHSLLRLRATLPRPTTIQTRIESVDPANRTVGVRLGGGVLELQVLSGAELTIRGQQAPLAAIRAGDVARVTYVQLPSGARVLLRAQVSQVALKRASGRISAVDVPNRRLTLTTRKGTLVLQLLGDETLTIDQFGEVQPGSVPGLKAFEGTNAQVEVAYVDRGTERVALSVRVTVLVPPPPPPPPG